MAKINKYWGMVALGAATAAVAGAVAAAFAKRHALEEAADLEDDFEDEQEDDEQPEARQKCIRHYTLYLQMQSRLNVSSHFLMQINST